MLNLLGEGITKGAKKAIKEGAEDVAGKVMKNTQLNLFEDALAKEAPDIVRVGSKNVAKINPKTLPKGYNILSKRLNDPDFADKFVAKYTPGAEFDKLKPKDYEDFLCIMGYDFDKSNMMDRVKNAVDEALAMDMDMEGQDVSRFLTPRANNSKFTDIDNFYLNSAGRTGMLDADLSDRLGIGRSTTPKTDTLNYPVGDIRKVHGDYYQYGIGTNPLIATGESGVSTIGHERLHSFQDNSYMYDPAVKEAYNTLHAGLEPYKLDLKGIKNFRGKIEGSSRNPDRMRYLVDDKEQEARMFQQFLEDAKYVNSVDRKTYALNHFMSGRNKEFDEGINKPFADFIKKLQGLSKKGIALPVGLALLLGSNYNSKKKEG